MKTRYFLISSLICSVFAVYFLYYHAWLSSTRRWGVSERGSPPDPSGQIDLLAQMASIAMAGAIVCLVFALLAAVLRAVRRRTL